MRNAWKLIRGCMAVLGGFLIYGGVGASDYYVMELKATEPPVVWSTIILGVVLILPSLVKAVIEIVREQ